MKIDDLQECSVCHTKELVKKRLMIEDFYGEYSLRDVKICMECDTLHYVHKNTIFYELYLKINKGLAEDEKEVGSLDDSHESY